MPKSSLRQLAWNLFLLMAVLSVAVGEERSDKLPSFADVEHSVRSHFAQDRNRREGDLISRSEVAEALEAVKELGWDVADAKLVLEAVLDDQHILVRTFRTTEGQRFARKVAQQKLIFDRLDRIAGVSGGPELIRDIVKLPNGEKYAKPRSGGGVPDLLDLLPKNASGKTRRIAKYDEPTGHLYTVEQLVKRLAESYQRESARKDPL